MLAPPTNFFIGGATTPLAWGHPDTSLALPQVKSQIPDEYFKDLYG